VTVDISKVAKAAADVEVCKLLGYKLIYACFWFDYFWFYRRVLSVGNTPWKNSPDPTWNM